MIIVGICGASGSGKSTLAKEIEDSLTCTSAIIGLDCYYRDHSDLPFEERVHINYDEPDIFDFDQLYADIQRLQGGLPITRKGTTMPGICGRTATSSYSLWTCSYSRAYICSAISA